MANTKTRIVVRFEDVIIDEPTNQKAIAAHGFALRAGKWLQREIIGRLTDWKAARYENISSVPSTMILQILDEKTGEVTEERVLPFDTSAKKFTTSFKGTNEAAENDFDIDTFLSKAPGSTDVGAGNVKN